MKLTLRPTTAGAAAALLAATLVLAGCSGESPEQLIASAKQYRADKDNKAAVIQLKNALQKQPNSAEARFLLGQTFLDSGDAVSAGVELGKALDLQYPQAAVIPVMARAQLAQGQSKKVVDQYATVTLGDAVADADLKTSLAIAYAAQGDSTRAKATLDTALQAAPDHAAALLFKARMLGAQRDFDGALATIDQILIKAPKDDEALVLQGDLRLHAKNDPAGALESYKKAVAAQVNNVAAHSGIVGVLLGQSKFDEAQTHLDVFKKVMPGHPQATYFEVQMAAARKDLAKATTLGEQLLKIVPDNVRTLQLMGAIELQKRNAAAAERHLTRAFQLVPNAPLTRRLLAQAYLASGQTAKALTTIAPLAESSTAPIDILELAAQAHLQAGDVAKAEELFNRVVKLNPQDSRSRTALALADLSKGHSEQAFDELQQIAAKDSGVIANMAMIAAHLQRRDFTAALSAIDGLEKKQPNVPLAPLLRARIQLAKKDVAGARKSFEQALAIDAAYFPAAAGLAELDLIDKKPDAARQRFESLLKAKPKHLEALQALAELKARTGGSKEEVTALIGKAIQAVPDDVAPRLQMIDHQLRHRDPKAALVAAQQATAAFPNDVRILDALGRAQLAAGDYNQALSAFAQVASLRPESPQGYLRQADVHLARKNNDAALQSLQRALTVTPDLIAAQRGVIALEMAAGRPREALEMARRVQQQRPNEFIGYALEGDAEAAQKRWSAAAVAYRAGLKKPGGAELAPKLHAVLTSAGPRAAADKWAADWMREHPKDLRFMFHMGSVALAQRNYAAAETQYQAILREQPENAAALNNMAWIAMQLKRPGAVALAEKANSLSPNQPAFMDTLAMALAQDKQLPRALEVQRKAVQAQPDNGALRLNLAKIYLESGDKVAARGELDTLAKLGDNFAAQSEVTQLLKGL